MHHEAVGVGPGKARGDVAHCGDGKAPGGDGRVRMASEDVLSMRVEEWYREREAFRAAVERELEAAERLDMAKQDPYHN